MRTAVSVRTFVFAVALVAVFFQQPWARDRYNFSIERGSLKNLDAIGTDTKMVQVFLLGDPSLPNGWTFDSGPNCTAQGWTKHDATQQMGDFFHVDDFNGLNGGLSGYLWPLHGLQSLWCGARPVESGSLCAYATLPGYGNNWDQAFCTKNCLSVGDNVTVTYLIGWDSESGYDGTTLEYDLCDYTWVPISAVNGGAGVYDGAGILSESVGIPDSLGGAIRIRFHFESDGAWSDEDGLWNTDGAVIVDLLSVTDNQGVVVPVEDFEGEAVGATSADNWQSCNQPGYGDFAALYPGLYVLQEDLCYSDLTCLWTFYTGSTDYYGCGGWPAQTAVPYGNERGQYIRNEIWSPMISWNTDWRRNPAWGTSMILEFDVYRDLQLRANVFYTWRVRAWSGDCPGRWFDLNYVYYGTDKDWLYSGRENGIMAVPANGQLEDYGVGGQRHFTPVFPLAAPGVDSIQVALGVVDMCGIWGGWDSYGNCMCHSHAPLFDNVKIYRLAETGPAWSVRDIDLFQDVFPGGGLLTTTAPADIANDITGYYDGVVIPGDSASVLVNDPTYGLSYDTPGSSAAGPAIYCWVSVRPRNPGNPFALEERDPLNEPGPGPSGQRWPLRGLYVVNSGFWGRKPSQSLTWYKIQFDSCFARSGRQGPADQQFCVDLNDNLFTAGDTILFFFEARNGLGAASYWSQFTGATANITEVANYPMEFQVLPCQGLPGAEPGGDILYVDDSDGWGPQSMFDTALDLIGISEGIDRYDVRGPESIVGNGPGSRVTDPVTQLIGNAGEGSTIYRKIIWNSGGLSAATVGDGTGRPCDEDDFYVLYTFLQQHDHPEGCGVYISGDDIAEEWANLTGASAVALRSDYMNFDLVSGAYDDYNHIVTPRILGSSTSQVPFRHPAGAGIPDTMVAYGGCPVANDFDVIAPHAGGSATTEMTYENDALKSAVVAQVTANEMGNPARVVLSGFSFHRICDDRPAGIPDRVHHLADILRWFENPVTDPTGGISGPEYVNALGQNYPNPFNPVTTIEYSIKESCHVTLEVFNVAGQLVRTLVSGDKRPGAYTTRWEGQNNAGASVSSGVYFCRIAAKDFTKTMKLVLLK